MAAVRQDGAAQWSIVSTGIKTSASMTTAVAIMMSAALPTAGQSQVIVSFCGVSAINVETGRPSPA